MVGNPRMLRGIFFVDYYLKFYNEERLTEYKVRSASKS